MKIKNFKYTIFSILLFFILLNFSFAKNIFEDSNSNSNYTRSANAGFAEEAFRRGVQSYYRGLFNDSIIQFERSLSYLPNENLIIDWLGKAYYKSGLEGAALTQWQFAHDAGYGGLLLENKIEIIRERRVTGIENEQTLRYSESGSFSGISADNKYLFTQPISILPNSDGTIWVLAYGSNELLLFDINGMIINRVTGSLVGFDRPVDIIRLSDDVNNGDLLISESAGNRLSVFSSKGIFKKYIGKKGRGIGELVGPQYLAQAENGNIYVSDFGNSRIAVFDKDGNGIFSFGQKSANFEGLKAPTGISIIGDSVYVCDSVTGAIYEFDLSGNFRELLVNEKTFDKPESMKSFDNYLIVSDKKHVSTVQLGSGIVTENAYMGNAPSRITCAIPDKNGNIIVSDFLSNEVYIMTKMSELLGGLFVQIEKIDAENFPTVNVEVRVQNRNRNPVVGLKLENFYLTENKRPCSNVKHLGSSSENTTQDIVLLIDRSQYMNNLENSLDEAVRSLAKSMQGVGNITVISSGAIPIVEYRGAPSGLLNFSSKVLKSKLTDSTAFDVSVRLATNELINAKPKRGIIYLTQGKLDDSSFSQYGITDLTSYLNNNSVSFSVIQLTQNGIDDEIKYICDYTDGKSYYVYRSQGLSNVISDIIDIPSGLYSFSFTSNLQTDLGRAYLPLEIETYLLNRSGRDETGYFSPLK